MATNFTFATRAVHGWYDAYQLDAGHVHLAERVEALRRVSMTTAPAGPGLEHYRFSFFPLKAKGLRNGAKVAGIITLGLGDTSGVSDVLWVDPNTHAPEVEFTIVKGFDTRSYERYEGLHENGPALRFYSGAALSVLLSGTVKRDRNFEFVFRYVGPQLMANIPLTATLTLMSSLPLSLRDAEDHMADSSWIFL